MKMILMKKERITFPLGQSFRESLVNDFENMNYMIKYGEFPDNIKCDASNKTPECVPLQRWGMPRKDKPVITRAYDLSLVPTTATVPANNYLNISIEEIEKIGQLISMFFLEYENEMMVVSAPKLKDSSIVRHPPSHFPTIANSAPIVKKNNPFVEKIEVEKEYVIAKEIEHKFLINISNYCQNLLLLISKDIFLN